MDHIILAATSVGLGTCYIAAFKPDKAREFRKLEDSEEPVLFTPLGYGNAEPRDTQERKLMNLQYIYRLLWIYLF